MFNLKNRRFAGILMLCISGQVGAEMVDGEELIDPTAPFLLSVEAALPANNIFATLSSNKLSSTLVRESGSVAIINGRRVREGEYIGSARVLDIRRNSVSLDLDGEERIINLNSISIKTKSGE